MTKFNLLNHLLMIVPIALLLNFLFFTKRIFTSNIFFLTEGWIIATLIVCFCILLVYKELNVRLPILLLLPFLLIEFFARIVFDLYQSFPLIDLFSHLFAGIGLGAIFILLLKNNLKSAVFFTFLVSLFSEGIELFNEYFIAQPVWLKDCLFCLDGITDISFNILGCILVWILLSRLKLRK